MRALVTGDHFRSRDKDGGHTVRSGVADSPMLHANFIELGLLPFEALHCENRDFRPFCSCDLDLDPMTFINEIDPYYVEMHRACKYELPSSRLSKVIV